VVRLNEVKFIKADRYYYDVDKNIIYGKQQYTKPYFHEVSHLNDHKNKLYAKWSLEFAVFGEFMAFLLPIYALLTQIFCPIQLRGSMFLAYLCVYAIYSAFIFQEEIRADIYAYFKHGEYKGRHNGN
jgi:hypothetical protein